MVQLLFSSFPDSFLCRRWRNVWLEPDLVLVCGQVHIFPELPVQAEGSMRWGVCTVNAKDLGPVTVSFSCPFIDAIRFVSPWPATRFREGRHVMDKRFRLPLAEGSTTVFQTTAASDGLYWAEPAWYRYFGDDVAGESAAIIDGTFSVAKDGLPLKPIFSEIILRLRTTRFV